MEETRKNQTIEIENKEQPAPVVNEKNSPETQELIALAEQSITLSTQKSSDSHQKKGRYKGKGFDAHGRPRNFYNPPGKVLRHLAQQNYYDNFYGNQSQFYQLKQKYKTQVCKHFQEEGYCPLQQFCQFAHGQDELRQPNDPLPKHFGKTALGAVHSNYKTQPCKNWKETGQCKFGDGCSFFHGDDERRKLIDPLPNLPEGVTLPVEPPRHYNKNYHYKTKGYNNNYNGKKGGNYEGKYMNKAQYNSNALLQITSLADLAAFGGFNPNKYLTQPTANPVQTSLNGNGAVPPHMVYAQQQMQIQMYSSGQPSTTNTPGQ